MLNYPYIECPSDVFCVGLCRVVGLVVHCNVDEDL